MQIELSRRQQQILGSLVEEYVATGEPVGSRTLVERTRMGVSSSTVRNEFAALEALGLLTHPHTSAGRVPTEHGYRLYAGGLLERLEPRPGSEQFRLDLTELRNEVESALQATTETLSEVTHLLALVSAPPLETASVRHVEVLLLQPTRAMVVVITSAGGVTKHLVEFEDAVDPGLASWGREYLNEELAGVRLGTRALRQRLEDPGLSPRERAFLDALRPAFSEAVVSQVQRLYVGGAAGLLGDARADELEACHRLVELLERRATLLELIGEVLEPRRPFVRVGEELENPALRDVALVGSTYGLANRTLGAVSLLGPVRMDYEKAIRSVRAAAYELSRFVEQLYEEG
ncbi:MAG: heat-inducible transcriptional repressor HrcA [Actinomycetota bacterium]|nr:heat-inducible transcriptional repressor HrcA [Actinomycetota bacterium]